MIKCENCKCLIHREDAIQMGCLFYCPECAEKMITLNPDLLLYCPDFNVEEQHWKSHENGYVAD